MTKSLAVLIVEDSESDVQLVLRLLTKAGYEINFERVETAEQLRAALEKQIWNIVISDYRMPELDGPAALKMLQDTGLDIPFIVVSGTVGEETAVEMMKAGAHDYLMKDSLVRLVPAVARELAQAEVRRERKRAEEVLRESEAKYRRLFEDAAIGVFHSSFADRFIEVNPALARMLGYDSPQEILDSIYSISEQVFIDLPQDSDMIGDTISKGRAIVVENRYRQKDGTLRVCNIILRKVLDVHDQPQFLEGFVEDITERKLAEEVLCQKIDQLQRFQRLTVGRELRMVELKKEINLLLKEAGKLEKYRIDESLY